MNSKLFALKKNLCTIHFPYFLPFKKTCIKIRLIQGTVTELNSLGEGNIKHDGIINIGY